MKLSLTLFSAFLCLSVFAQFETDYTPIKSKGKLPQDFITQSSQKYLAEKSQLKEKGNTKKTKDKFLLESNFEIDNLILSGRVLFNDPLSEYVNKVAANVLVNNKELLSKIRFYILKSPSVNATSTNQGIIFINIGLLAQVENEAQLAYIISHEVEHYVLKHSITQAVENEIIQRGKGNYRSLGSNDDKFVAKCNFSKEQEAEADVKGFELFRKSKYSSEDLINVFDVLKYSYLPFDEVDFNKSYFETEYFKLPAHLDISKTKDINTSDEDDDEKSTHPSIKARRLALSKLLATENSAGKSFFLVGQNEFEKARTIARFEQSRLYLLFHSYTKSIYNSYLLQKEYPNNLFLQKNIMCSLAGLAEYSANGDLHEVQASHKEIEGKSQSLYYLFDKLDSADESYIGSLALGYAAKIAESHPDDEDVKVALQSIASSLDLKGKGLDYYYDKSVLDSVKVLKTNDSLSAVKDSTVQTVAKADSSTTITFSKSSKYQKIKSQEVKVEKVKSGSYEFAQLAIAQFKSNKRVVEAFENTTTKSRKSKSETNSYKRSKINKTSQFCGIDKVVVMTPFYMKMVDSKKTKIKYLKGESGQIDFSKRMTTIAKKAKVETELLNVRNLEETEVEKLNDITAMQEYFRDRVSHTDAAETPFHNRSQMLDLAKKYGSDYFMWTGMISYREDPSKTTKLAILTATLPFLVPFTLQPLINNGRWTLYYNIIYNVQTDELVFTNYREINNRTAGYIMDQNIYDTFYQIKQKPVEKKEAK